MNLKVKLGYTSFSNWTEARDFDGYLLFRGITSVRQIDEGFLVNWIHSIRRHSPGTKNMKIRFARGFLRHLMRMGLAQENPAMRISYLRHTYRKPYIYTLKEIHQIIEEAKKYKPQSPSSLLASTLETMISLIYACGLRITEATSLKIGDVDFEDNIISLRNTKFHKERLVPFSQRIAEKLKAYLLLRKERGPSGPATPFFLSTHGPYSRKTIEYYFHRIVLRCGLVKGKGRAAPCLHDLRHAFAVHRLYKWYQDGFDLLNKLPLLSTYMGHVEIQYTQVYLTITRALLREGNRRFRNAFEDVVEKTAHRVLRKR